MRISRAFAALTIAMLTCATAQATEITGDELKKALQENPNALIEAIRANRKAIFDIINQTGLEEQARAQQETEEAERTAYEDAKQFGFNGTPGFLLNGIPIRGAYPIEYFEDVIKTLDAAKAD